MRPCLCAARIGLLLLAALVAGCTSVEFVPTPSARPYHAYKGEVVVLDEFPPAGTFRHLGVVLVTGRSLSDDKRLLKALRKEAAVHGANAIVIQDAKVTRIVHGGTQTLKAAVAIRQR